MTLAELDERIIACEQCPRLRAYCREIGRIGKREFAGEEYWARPVPSFGDPHARLLIVGLAPAAHGANRTGQMFTGDSSGSWFYEALHRYGWSNRPNALRRDDGLDRCHTWVVAELALLPDVRVVLALGRVGWEGWLRASGWWDRLSARERPPFAHDRETTLPDGTVLVTSFHPSRQNTNTGKLTRAMWYAVFDRIRRVLP